MESVWARPPDGPDSSAPELLVDHATEVAAYARNRIPESATLATGTSIRNLTALLGYTHDLAKSTTWNQQYLGNPNAPPVEQPLPGSQTHAPLSARATFWLCSKIYDPWTSVIAALAVARHHGSIPRVSEYGNRLIEQSDADQLIKQIQNIQAHTSETVDSLFNGAAEKAVSEQGRDALHDMFNTGSPTDAFAAAITSGDLREAIANRLGAESVLPGIESLTVASKYTSERAYTDLHQLWGCLKGCDTLAAADEPLTQPKSRATPQTVATHLQTLPSPSNTLEEALYAERDTARHAAVRRATNTPDAELYTLTLPTGTGKTLIGTQAALASRKQRSNPGPLIYALPFTSAVNQTAKTFSDLLNSERQTGQLTIDPHLTSGRQNGNSSQTRTTTLAQNAWLSDVTLTTTIQLLETLTAPDTAQAPRIPSLYNCTLIIDSPQSLPLDWYPPVESLVNTLTKTYNATVILMSATQPVFNTTKQPVELGVNISLPSRVEYYLDKSVTGSSVAYETAAQRLLDSVCKANDSTLAVANTIASAQQLHDAVASKTQLTTLPDLYDDLYDDTAATLDAALPDPQELTETIIECDPDTLLTCPLTSRHRPCDRRRILTALNNALEADAETPPLLAITTQLIEIGVDISFDAVYRDIAPYDTLIQAAGRCNRNYENGIAGGDVTIWQLSHPPKHSGPTPAELIYATKNTVNRLNITRTVLNSIAPEGGSIDEQDMLNAEQTYQKRLAERRPTDSKISTALSECDGSTLANTSVIDPYQTVPTIISKSTAEDELINEYQEAVTHHDYATATDRLGTLRRLQVDLPTTSSQSVKSIGDDIEDTTFVTYRDATHTDVITTTYGVQHPTTYSG